MSSCATIRTNSVHFEAKEEEWFVKIRRSILHDFPFSIPQQEIGSEGERRTVVVEKYFYINVNQCLHIFFCSFFWQNEEKDRVGGWGR